MCVLRFVVNSFGKKLFFNCGLALKLADVGVSREVSFFVGFFLRQRD